MLQATCDGCSTHCDDDFETWTVYAHQVGGDGPDDTVHGQDFHLCHGCAESVRKASPIDFADASNTLIQEIV